MTKGSPSKRRVGGGKFGSRGVRQTPRYVGYYGIQSRSGAVRIQLECFLVANILDLGRQSLLCDVNTDLNVDYIH